MANLYVRSTDGINTDNGSTWALAKLDLAGFDAAPDAAGDTAYISQSHSEATGAAVTIAVAGTIAAPTKLICVNDAAEPPTATATTAVVSTTGAFKLRVSGNLYAYGIAFKAGGVGVNFANLELNYTGLTSQIYENCSMTLVNSHPSSFMVFGGQAGGDSTKTELINCNFSFASTGQSIAISGEANINGGAFLSGTLSPVNGVFSAFNTGKDAQLLVENVDFSNLSTSFAFVTAPTGVAHKVGNYKFRNIKLPGSWAGSLFTSAIASPGCRAEVYNAISGASVYYVMIDDTFGTLRDSQTIYRSSGYAQRSVQMSLKMTTTANTSYLSNCFKSNVIERAYPGTAAEDAAFVAGATKTITVEFVHDTNVAAGQGSGTSFAFTNKEFSMEVKTLDSLGNVVKTTKTTLPSNILSTAADLTTSASTWTTTGLTTAVKQKFSVNVSPQEKGTFLVRILGFSPSKTIYYCPLITVS